MHKIELICYAGSLACLKAALNSGADSVYVGGESFGRDTLSQEFSREDLIEGIKFAHENNKKVYVTINLLPHNKDFDKFKEFLNDLNEMKVDAVIVSEPGTLITVKQLLPEMKIHLGNVSNVYNYETANFWHNQVADRVVISRELSIKEIEMMRLKTPESLELEAYVHGPIVMSYSGRKLITSYLESKGKENYSSKKRYNLTEEKRQGQYCPVYEDEAGTIFFSSRDLCMIEYLDKFIRAGVSTLTIEARLQDENYINTVVPIYRKAIDDFYNNNFEYNCSEDMLETLKNATTRKHTTGFYLDETVDYD
ncbi:peptidase U32 family protein [Intestinibacter bartlettii]|uniref:peptidase U32 family protein n=1 Tax=Intestinibacter bartlettii TaxID=261299 RepID=UPI00321B4018